jgi:hypothetical protein
MMIIARYWQRAKTNNSFWQYTISYCCGIHELLENPWNENDIWCIAFTWCNIIVFSIMSVYWKIFAKSAELWWKQTAWRSQCHSRENCQFIGQNVFPSTWNAFKNVSILWIETISTSLIHRLLCHKLLVVLLRGLHDQWNIEDTVHMDRKSFHVFGLSWAIMSTITCSTIWSWTNVIL